jgi:hypothetical protein
MTGLLAIVERSTGALCLWAMQPAAYAGGSRCEPVFQDGSHCSPLGLVDREIVYLKIGLGINHRLQMQDQLCSWHSHCC